MLKDTAKFLPQMQIDEILKFHFVFDKIGLNGVYNDVFEAIECEILNNIENLQEQFSDIKEYEVKKALMKFAKSDRKKIGISKILPRFTALKVLNNLLCRRFLILEKSHEQKPVKLHKNDKLPREIRHYQITDKIHFATNFDRFWFRFIEPNLEILKLNQTQEILNLIKDDFENYASLGFEILSKELLGKYLNIKSSEISSYWDKNVEIDIYAKIDDFCIVGECKYKDRKISKNILNELYAKCEIAGIKPNLTALFSKSGFSNELKKAKSENVLLFEMEDFKILL